MENTSTRDAILARIRAGKPQSRELPEIPVYEIIGTDIANFVCHLKGFDGRFEMFENRTEAINWLRKNIPATDKKLFSALPELTGNVDLADFRTPAEMHIIDTCVAEALLAVGETGSLLVDTQSLGNPAAALFSTDLYLLIDRNKMVDGLQDAYAAIDLNDFQYSSFFTGPSATADIEAVHITGAQGFVSLTAIIYNCSDTDRESVKNVMSRLPNGTPLGQPDAKVEKMVRYTDIEKGQDSV